MPSNAPGRGDPYWYEWFVGIPEVLALLDPASDVVAVSFQVPGQAPWDDVVVQLRSGRRRCYQVKHTREKDSLTFGDLVKKDAEGKSLLSALYSGWRSSGLDDGVTECILFTNRDAGTRWSQTDTGIQRPPLLQFWSALRGQLDSVQLPSQIVMPDTMLEGLGAFFAELTAGTENEALRFLRSLSIRTNREDLEPTVEMVRSQLAAIFGVSHERVTGVLDALHRALRKWTTGYQAVTVEELCDELAIRAETDDLAPAPPPPAPFFPTRIRAANDIERALANKNSKRVLFLSGEPGAGKTSVVSWLSNRRVVSPFYGIVGVRFFCFEPIRPECPFLAPDGSRVRARELWFSLLSQIREGLRGRLHEFSVPVRNDLLTWPEARGHVLRLADLIGVERNCDFVIAVDGIDHAARASQLQPVESAEFFQSLPGPDELATKRIRLLIAGQPPHQYRDHYPRWLQREHPDVHKYELDALSSQDICAIYEASATKIPTSQAPAVVRLIEEKSSCNTLAVVFAVAEAASFNSVQELQKRLDERLLSDGLDAYYNSIWNHMLLAAGALRQKTDAALSGVLSLARTDVTAGLLKSTFHGFDMPLAWWQQILDALAPMIISCGNGFRVRHNDVRVFLTSQFLSFPRVQRVEIASQLADHYVLSSSDRQAAHLHLFDLLRLADRDQDLVRNFTVDWVFEAVALGVDNDRLKKEAALALTALSETREWSLAVSVACAVQTMARYDSTESYGVPADQRSMSPLPPFLSSESAVRPIKQWRISDFVVLVRDARTLADAGSTERAVALLNRWLNGLSVGEVVSTLEADDSERLHRRFDNGRIDDAFTSSLVTLGSLAAELKWTFPAQAIQNDGNTETNQNSQISKADFPRQDEAIYHFEKGYVETSTRFATPTTTLSELFAYCIPRFIRNWEACASIAAERGLWPLVVQLLDKLAIQEVSWEFRAKAPWWILKAGGSFGRWGEALDLKNFRKRRPTGRGFGLEEEKRCFESILELSKAVGWTRLDLDPGDVADLIYLNYVEDKSIENRAQFVLVCRSAALLGRISGALNRGGVCEACILVRPEDIGQALHALWGPATRAIRFNYSHQAAAVAQELALISKRLGGDHQKASCGVARTYLDQSPVDFRRSGLADAVLGTADEPLLIKWIDDWLPQTGKVWHLSREEMGEIVLWFCELAKRIGRGEIADYAKSRMPFLQISYVGHKEYVFADILDWFKEAARYDPSIWANEGWKLWTLCDECDAQSGDNRLESEIRNTISAAAIECGPSAWWRLICTTLSSIEQSGWHDSMQNRLVIGATVAIENSDPLTIEQFLYLLSIAVSFSFWHEQSDNVDMSRLWKAFCTKSLDGDISNSRRNAIAAVSLREFEVIAQVPVNGSKNEESVVSPYSLDATLRLIETDQILPSEASKAVSAVIAERPHERGILVSRILTAVGTGTSVADWSYFDTRVEQSLAEIAAHASDDDLWCLVSGVARDVERCEYWLTGSFSNLFAITLARARQRGVEPLLAGIRSQIQMHSKWAFGGDFNGAWPVLPQAENLDWREIAVRLHAMLLESSSGEVVAAATEGIHVLVAHDPTAIGNLFDALDSNWSRKWWLLSAECWASLYPNAVENVRVILERIVDGTDFAARLQAWIVLCRLADVSGRHRPTFPLLDRPSVGLQHARKLLTRPPLRQGRNHLIDENIAARNLLGRLARLGFNFGPIEGVVAQRLEELRNDPAYNFPQIGIRRCNFFSCNALLAEAAVGYAISSVLSRDWCSENDLIALAQGFLQNEDPWMMRRSPQPADRWDRWPSFSEFGSNDSTDSQIVGEMRQLAKHGGIQDGWRTFAARTLYSTHQMDFELEQWFETTPKQPFLIEVAKAPLCPSGRTFQNWLGDPFEPNLDDGCFVSAFFVGATQSLSCCGFDIQPASAWQKLLGWEPDPLNPFQWKRDGEVVARYQQVYGPLRISPRNPTYRQPLLQRWSVSDNAYAQVQSICGELRLREHLTQHPFES